MNYQHSRIANTGEHCVTLKLDCMYDSWEILAGLEAVLGRHFNAGVLLMLC